MKLYADLPGRRTVQLLADLGLLGWVAVWAWVGRYVHDATLSLAKPGAQLRSAGAGFRSELDRASGSVAGLPLLGDRLAGPLHDVAAAGTSMQDAGSQLVAAVTHLANILGWVTALVPIVIGAASWALLRGRFVRRASAAQRFIDDAADLDLFALRAMATQPMRKLARVSDDPAGAWRRGDAATIRALALLELGDSGLSPPAGPAAV